MSLRTFFMTLVWELLYRFRRKVPSDYVLHMSYHLLVHATHCILLPYALLIPYYLRFRFRR